jgi:hypothetical protein
VFQRQRCSRELLDQVIAELNSRMSLDKMIHDDRTNLLLSVIAIVGLPFSLGLGSLRSFWSMVWRLARCRSAHQAF